MAPLRPSPSSSRNARPLKSILKKPSNASSVSADTLFASSKKDKRRIKHAQLINKVTKSADKKPKRRRPNKKLVTTLDALADALPDDDSAREGALAAAGEAPQDQVNIIKRKSMKSRPGALKRRENIDKGERDRFAKNMAQLAAARPAALVETSSTNTPAIASTSERWAALRGFISQTLEKKPELTALKT